MKQTNKKYSQSGMVKALQWSKKIPLNAKNLCDK